MAETTLAYAVQLIQTGKFDEAEKALLEMFEEPSKREKAWAWLYVCAHTNDQKTYCLRKVLEINPSYDDIPSRLGDLGDQLSTSDLQSIKNTNETKTETKTEAEADKQSSKVESSPKKDKERKIPYKPPKVISRNLDEDFYAKGKYALSDFPDTESGMYGSKLLTGGIFISPLDHPKCFEAGHALHKSLCHVCEFFAEPDCPVRKDPDILREAKILFAIRKRYWQEGLERRDSAIEAIYTELRDHGRPLHYEIISQMVEKRYPKLKLSSWAVLRIMTSHPEKFESTDRGVYKAK